MEALSLLVCGARKQLEALQLYLAPHLHLYRQRVAVVALANQMADAVAFAVVDTFSHVLGAKSLKRIETGRQVSALICHSRFLQIVVKCHMQLYLL